MSNKQFDKLSRLYVRQDIYNNIDEYMRGEDIYCRDISVPDNVKIAAREIQYAESTYSDSLENE